MAALYATPNMIRFGRLRKKLAEGIRKQLEEDGHCKSYEGTWEILEMFPSFFDDPAAEAPADFVEIRLHCYVIGPSRHYKWVGSSFEEAIEKAEIEVDSWLRPWREEQ